MKTFFLNISSCNYFQNIIVVAGKFLMSRWLTKTVDFLSVNSSLVIRYLQHEMLSDFCSSDIVQYHPLFNGLRWEVVVCFVDIGGIVDHQRLNFLFIRWLVCLAWLVEDSFILLVIVLGDIYIYILTSDCLIFPLIFPYTR